MGQQQTDPRWNDLIGSRSDERLDRPVAAVALSILGGVFVIISGALIASSGIGAESIVFGPASSAFVSIGVIEAILGLVVSVFGAYLYDATERHVDIGIVIVVFSAFAFVGLGGAALGGLLGVVGGVLAIVYTPAEDRPAPSDSLPRRVCLKCGWLVGPDAKVCPRCGHDFAEI